MPEQIVNGKILLPDGQWLDGTCAFEDGILCYLGAAPLANANTVLDAQGQFILPGFIDLHCHGGNGYDFMDATHRQMEEIARFHLQHGTTTLVATTMTDTWASIYSALERINDLFQTGEPKNIYGVHLEGPWLNPLQCGAQDLQKMSLPDPSLLTALVTRYPFVSRISVAPELPGGFAIGKTGTKLGVVMSVAHTDADCAQVQEAASCGYSLMTHLFSGMKMTYRKDAYRTAGAVEGGLLDDRLFVELIADGKHLPIDLLKLVYKVKGPQKICLVTDAVRGAGLPEGSHFRLGRNTDGVDAIIEDGVAKLPDRSSFAGSVATADRLLQVMHKDCRIPLHFVSQMLSDTPALVMGYQDRGSIALGKRADLVLLDESLQVTNVFLGGKQQ